MSLQRNFLFYVIVATSAAVPAIAQTSPSGGVAGGITQIASVPDFSGTWQHPVFPWFEPPASGPGPITNLSRWPESAQIPDTGAGTAALPPTTTGVSDYDQLVGDYRNPILQPWAAEIVKKFGEQSLAGITVPNPSNQCWPEPMPFIYKRSTVLVLQGQDTITLHYGGDVRVIRMNASHPSPLTPSWYGDSVGHYEGDTLVIDTVGVKTDRPYAMQDLFGTPYTDKLHIVERYRLRNYDEVKDALERNAKENWMFAGDVFRKHRGKFLQVHVTVEDDGVFTSPFTATLTYVPSSNPLGEAVCAENPHEYYNNKDSDVPKADKADF
jgi:hypothetical protein